MQLKILFFLLFLAFSACFAKRAVPSPVPPIVKDGIQYVANECGMGCVKAIELKTKKELWKVTLYKIEFIKGLEEDVQWVFIKEMKLSGDKLIVTNERNDRYEINLSDHSFSHIITKAVITR
jgi:hypothetical protein